MMDRLTSRETLSALARFLLVGGGFAAGYAVVTAILTGPLGAPAFVTSACIYLLCIPAAFLVQRKVTFRAQETRTSGFLIYAGTQVVSFLGVSYFTTRFVSGNVLIDTPIFLATAGSAAVVSFVILRCFAFKTPA